MATIHLADGTQLTETVEIHTASGKLAAVRWRRDGDTHDYGVYWIAGGGALPQNFWALCGSELNLSLASADVAPSLSSDLVAKLGALRHATLGELWPRFLEHRARYGSPF